MQLTDLNLNRFIYRTVQTIQTADSSIMATSAGAVIPSGNAVATGGAAATSTLITGTILQSSGSDNRIEINPNDTLIVYNKGVAAITIDHNGIVVNNVTVTFAHIVTADIDTANITTETVGTSNITNATITTETVGTSNIANASITNAGITTENVGSSTINTLHVTGTETLDGQFIRNGLPQPVIYTGIVSAGGSMISGPAGWSASSFGGPIYILNHTLGTTQLTVFITPTTSTVATSAANIVSSSTILIYSADPSGAPNYGFSFLVLLPF